MNDAPIPVLDGALCVQADDPELWFPLPGGPQPGADAKAVCDTCPAQNACLTFAVANPVHGIWGGTTEQERRTIAARKGLGYVPPSFGLAPARTTGCGTPAGYRRHLRDGEKACAACLAGNNAEHRRWERERAG